MALKLYKQRRTKPYYANGKTVFNIQGKPGVYLIYRGEKIVYIGYSGTNLYKTMYRHFQKWDDPRQQRVTYTKLSDITVRVVYTNSGYQAAKLEKALIVKYNPEDNPSKYEQYTITPIDTENIKTFTNATAAPIVRDDDEYPF